MTKLCQKLKVSTENYSSQSYSLIWTLDSLNHGSIPYHIQADGRIPWMGTTYNSAEKHQCRQQKSIPVSLYADDQRLCTLLTACSSGSPNKLNENKSYLLPNAAIVFIPQNNVPQHTIKPYPFIRENLKSSHLSHLDWQLEPPVCTIWGAHTCGYGAFYLLGYYTV